MLLYICNWNFKTIKGGYTMKKASIIKKLAAFCAVIMFLFTLTPSTQAADVTAYKDNSFAISFLQESYNISETEALDLYYEAEKAQKFYKFDENGNLSFDSKGALANNVDPAVVKEITDTFKNLELNNVKLNKNIITAAATDCKGVQKYDPNNSRVYGNSCKTDDLVWNLKVVATAVALSGIVAALFGMIHVAAAYEAAALLISLGADYVDRKNKGCGIIVYWAGSQRGVYSQTGCSN